MKEDDRMVQALKLGSQ